MSRKTKKRPKAATTRKAGKSARPARTARTPKTGMSDSARTPDATEKPMSGLDAAAEILADADKPMRARELVDAMIDGGLWKSGGKTPHSTIYAAMIREIAAKGDASRFRKTDRGLFAFNG